MEVGGSSPLHPKPLKSILKHNYSRTAAALAAVAINEAFPGSEFLGGEATSRGFVCQFYYSFSLPPESLPMLEERMRQVVRENRPIQELEMVSYCAKELFIKLGHKGAVEALRDCAPKELVSLVQIGDFYELMDGPFCSSIRDVGAFKVTSLAFQGEGIYRVEGCAFATKVELKEYVRKLAQYEEGNHLSIAERFGFLSSIGGGVIWKEKGLKIKRELIAFFRQAFLGEEVSFSNEDSLKKYAQTLVAPGRPFIAWNYLANHADPEGSEGFFEEGSQSLVQQIIYSAPEELKSLLISLLQTIDKTLIILGFHAYIQLAGRKKSEKALALLESVAPEKTSVEFDGLAGARAQWIVLDGLGRQQVAVEVELQADLSSVTMKVGVEKILALLLEQTDVSLPSWLIPEHVRVLALSSGQLDYANEVKAAVEAAGYPVSVDCRATPLKLRLSDASKEGLPFVLIVGEKESQTNTVALRERGSERSEPLRMCQLTERMKRIFEFEKTRL